ncbi:MAG: hypothetical protein R3F14_17665 [Polyangiaceae bacterium]
MTLSSPSRPTPSSSSASPRTSPPTAASSSTATPSATTPPDLGTTNVDYSLALYEHFQTLRTYRPTRLLVDPSGFE